MQNIRGRFAPSPSGEMHLGNAWTALLAWLQVRSLGGTMVLRLEDLDPDRCRPDFGVQIIADLKWLGLDWDEGPDCGGEYGPYIQSQRRGLYQNCLDSLAAQGLLYSCYCTRAEIQAAASAPHGDGDTVYPGTCRRRTSEDMASRRLSGRQPAVRLAVTPGKIRFEDGLYGSVMQDLSAQCGDFIVRRSDGVHAYQLAVVADDAAMRITHVLRGDDLLSSTPRQLLLYRLLGFSPPEFTHVPLLYSSDGHRLSKRQRDLSLAALKKRGVAAKDIIGFLAWKANLVDTPKPIAASELINGFTLKRILPEKVIVELSEFQ